MNFSLRKLESNIGEAHLLRAEELLDAHAVEPVREIDRHLWVTHVRDGNDRWEVEIKISPSRIVAATCECPVFQTEGECEHFAAALLTLRRHLQNRHEKKRQKKKRAARQSSKLTTSVVLRNVDPDELTDFVREYARTHRNFAIALKARFATNVDSIDAIEKFSQLLDSTINMARRPDRSISKRGEQKIVKVLREMHDQAREAIAEQHFTETLSIAQSILQKVTPVLGKVTTDSDTLLKEVEAAFELIRQLLSFTLPPDLRHSLWRYLLEEHPKLTYRSHQLDHLFLQQMLELANEPKDFDQLLEAISRQTEKYQSEGRQPAKILMLQLLTLEKAGRPKAAEKFIEENLLHPKILRRTIDLFIQNEQWRHARQLCLSGLEKFQDQDLKKALEHSLITISKKQGDITTLRSILETQFLRELDLRIYQELRKLQEDNKLATFHRELTKKVRKHTPPSRQQLDVLAFLHAESGQTDALLRYLEETASLDLLKRYDHYLLQKDKEGLLHLYRQLLTQYIQNHLGPKSSSKIRQTLHHLHEIGMGDLATRLTEEFRSNYPERHTLMEELALF